MERVLEERIILEAKKRIATWRSKERKRFTAHVNCLKKTGRLSVYRPLDEPPSWSYHKQFDPRYCIKHARFLSRGLIRAVRNGQYRPIPARRTDIPKGNGEYRTVYSFSIPDAAICSLLSEALRERNSKVFSANSFAFRDGMTPLDAVVRLANYMKAEKVFISKYDFKNYFDSVSHEFILRDVLGSRKFHITQFERSVLVGVISHDYIGTHGVGARSAGFPQGNSLSLFLANAVGTYLDDALDRRNGNYIRFADDSIVINYSYEDSINATEAYSEFSQKTRVNINKEKTTGISILSDRVSEMRTSNSIDFLGYKISKNTIELSDRAIERIKSRCSKLIYRHLLLYPRSHGQLSMKRLGPRSVDWDLVSCIYDLRRMLYGNLKQHQVNSFLSGRYRLKQMPGDISYYCLVEKVDQFAQLDGWLLWALHRALRERQAHINLLYPHLQWSIPTQKTLISTRWFWGNRRKFDVSLPSFVLAWRAGRKAWASFGHMGVDNGSAAYANQS